MIWLIFLLPGSTSLLTHYDIQEAEDNVEEIREMSAAAADRLLAEAAMPRYPHGTNAPRRAVAFFQTIYLS